MNMHVSIEWRDGQWPTFKIILAKQEGAEPFLEIKDCRLIDGSKGQFVSYPARKDDKGKYWPYLYGGEAFNAHIVKLANESKPRPEMARSEPPRRAPPTKPMMSADGGDDIPF